MKRVSKLEIRSKKIKKTGVIYVSVYADSVKLAETYIADGAVISLDSMMTGNIALDNGLLILTLPKIGNAKNI